MKFKLNRGKSIKLGDKEIPISTTDGWTDILDDEIIEALSNASKEHSGTRWSRTVELFNLNTKNLRVESLDSGVAYAYTIDNMEWIGKLIDEYYDSPYTGDTFFYAHVVVDGVEFDMLPDFADHNIAVAYSGPSEPYWRVVIGCGSDNNLAGRATVLVSDCNPHNISCSLHFNYHSRIDANDIDGMYGVYHNRLPVSVFSGVSNVPPTDDNVIDVDGIFELGQTWAVYTFSANKTLKHAYHNLKVREADDGVLYIGDYEVPELGPFYISTDGVQANLEHPDMLNVVEMRLVGQTGELSILEERHVPSKYLPSSITKSINTLTANLNSLNQERIPIVKTKYNSTSNYHVGTISNFNLVDGQLVCIIPDSSKDTAVKLNNKTFNVERWSPYGVRSGISPNIDSGVFKSGWPLLCVVYNGSLYDVMFNSTFACERGGYYFVTCSTTEDIANKVLNWQVYSGGFNSRPYLLCCLFDYGNTADDITLTLSGVSWAGDLVFSKVPVYTVDGERVKSGMIKGGRMYLFTYSIAKITLPNGIEVPKNVFFILNPSDVSGPPSSVTISSSTEGSSKTFKITVDDTGTLSATEVTD